MWARTWMYGGVERWESDVGGAARRGQVGGRGKGGCVGEGGGVCFREDVDVAAAEAGRMAELLLATMWGGGRVRVRHKGCPPAKPGARGAERKGGRGSRSGEAVAQARVPIDRWDLTSHKYANCLGPSQCSTSCDQACRLSGPDDPWAMPAVRRWLSALLNRASHRHESRDALHHSAASAVSYLQVWRTEFGEEDVIFDIGD